MYKYLLCWRYLLTRYLALACIVSVMLGVATLIVVNSVMSGFSTKLKQRLHGILSDVLVESTSMDGFPDPEAKMRAIHNSPIGAKIEAMTPTLEVFAMITFRVHPDPQRFRSETTTRPVHVIGIDPVGRAKIGGFAEHLINENNRRHPSFELPAEARKQVEARSGLPFIPVEMPQNRLGFEELPPIDQPPPPDPPPSSVKIPEGVILGHAIAHFRWRNPETNKIEDMCMLRPGDDVILTTVSGQKLAPVYDRFVIADYFKSEMSEYDSNYVFVPLAHLQKLRTMENRVTSIQIKLKDYRDAKVVVETLSQMFPMPVYKVETWEAKQGALLAAIAIEKGILNVLLFLIICVAGFGILAIFAMIVVEKTRDIGILKALGASNAGVMKIFLGYGLLLGLIGAGLGTALGVTFTIYINEIEQFLGMLTGHEIFDKSVYYFKDIPTDIQAWSVVLVNIGSVAIAVFFSIVPALRAALLHPVKALRYE